MIFHYQTVILILRLSIIFCLFTGDIYLSLGISLCLSLSFSFAAFSGLFCCEFFESFVIFDILLLHYFNLGSSIVSCFSFEDIYLSLGISLSYSFISVFELVCYKSFETFVTLSAILLPIKSPVASAVFEWRRFKWICCKFVSIVKRFLAIVTT